MWSKVGASRKPASCSVTAHMVRDAVEELEMRRERVPLSLLLTHFQRRYPVDKDPESLKRQIVEQADKAVRLGWLRKYADETYSLASFAWSSTIDEWGWD